MYLIIAGYGRHGKDTYAGLLAEIAGLPTPRSSSWFARDWVWGHGHTDAGQPFRQWYATPEHCWEGRHEFRAEWYRQIRRLNATDPHGQLQLYRLCLAAQPFYIGLRDQAELYRLRIQMPILSIWVRRDSVAPEAEDSITVTEQDCDLTVLNNGSLEELRAKARRHFRARGVDWLNPAYGWGRSCQ